MLSGSAFPCAPFCSKLCSPNQAHAAPLGRHASPALPQPPQNLNVATRTSAVLQEQGRRGVGPEWHFFLPLRYWRKQGALPTRMPKQSCCAYVISWGVGKGLKQERKGQMDREIPLYSVTSTMESQLLRSDHLRTRNFWKDQVSPSA